MLMDLRRDAADNAEKSWKKHKAPMAAYWKAVAVYAGHAARLLRTTCAAWPRRQIYVKLTGGVAPQLKFPQCGILEITEVGLAGEVYAGVFTCPKNGYPAERITVKEPRFEYTPPLADATEQ